MLSDAEVRRARPGARPFKMWDGQGLYLLVMPNGRRTWLVRTRSRGRERLLTLGAWPELSLDDARRKRDAALAGLTIDGGPKTFEDVARTWHALHRAHWSTAHAADVIASLERDVFPAIGTMPIGTIAAPDLLGAIRALEARGRGQTARRVRQRCAAVFGYAISEGLAKENPAATIAAALLPPGLTRPHPALTQIESCRALLDACDHIAGAGNMVCLASRFLALTAVRLDAVRGMRWGEIEELDGLPVWRVPAARMKLAKAKKDEERFAHLVPLAPAALQLLERAASENGYDTCSAPANGLVFPGRGKNCPIGERAIGALYVRAGYAGRHVPHGWRASFSTILNEQLPAERAAIDLALAHAPKDKVEGAYNRSEQLERRRRLMEHWAELLTA